MQPTWKVVTSYPNYSVGSDGQIRNNKTGRILRPLVLTKGYHGVRLYHKGNGKTLKVHRLVALAFLPGNFEGAQVNHINGDKSYNAVDNLEWCSNADNMAHAISTGLVNTSGQFRAKYDPDQVKHMHQQGMSVADIARTLGCKWDTAKRLVAL